MTTLLGSDIELVSSGVNKGDVIFLFFPKGSPDGLVKTGTKRGYICNFRG
jgi:hypothetical protein